VKRSINCRAGTSLATTSIGSRSGCPTIYLRFLRIIFDQPSHHTVGVFAKNAFPLNAVDIPQSFVIASLNARESVAAVHDVRFAINDGTTKEPRREQIARIHVSHRSNLRHGVCRWIFVGRQVGFASHRGSDRVGKRQFFIVSAAQEPANHFKALIIKFQLVFQIRTVHQQMKMIIVD
jgi:hypothetical protein